MSALPLVVVPSGNSSTGGKSWQEAFLCRDSQGKAS